MPSPSGSVTASFVGMSSPSSRASRASSLMSAAAALIGSALAWFQRSTRFGSISAKAHAHIPSGLIRAGSEHAMDLVCADAFLAGQHQVQDSIPHEQRLLGFLEDGSSLEREAIRRAVIFAALFALPMPRARLARVNTLVKVARGAYTSGPAPTVEVRATSLFVRKHPVEISKGHLTHEAGFRFSAHGKSICEILADYVACFERKMWIIFLAESPDRE